MSQYTVMPCRPVPFLYIPFRDIGNKALNVRKANSCCKRYANCPSDPLKVILKGEFSGISKLIENWTSSSLVFLRSIQINRKLDISLQ